MANRLGMFCARLFSFDKSGPNKAQYGLLGGVALAYLGAEIYTEVRYRQEEQRSKETFGVPYHPAYLGSGSLGRAEGVAEEAGEGERGSRGRRKRPWRDLFRSTDYYLTGNMRDQMLESDGEMEERLRRELGSTTYSIWRSEGFIPDPKASGSTSEKPSSASS